MSSFRFSHRVRYQETDAQTFVFHSRYLEWADVAMVEFFRGLGWTYPQMDQAGFDPSVVTTTINFKKPARFDDVIDIDVDCTAVGNSSFELRFLITRGDELVCEITTTYVNVEVKTARSTPIPAPIAGALRRVTAAGS
jgi:acyl-CoA thioester hydrolase